MRRAILVGFAGFLSCFSAGLAAAAQWTQMFPADSPPARMCAGMAYDESRNRLVVFGGTPDFSRKSFFNDT